MWHSELHVTDPHRKKRSPSAAITPRILFAIYCCLMVAVLLPMNPTTRQRIFSKSFLSTCNALTLNTRNFRSAHIRDHYLSVASTYGQPPPSRCASYFIHNDILRKHSNPYNIRGQIHFTTLLAATSATSRGRRSKSTSKQKQISLVVKGPPGFLCPPMEDDRPFKLVIVESPSKCQTISKILQEYVNENNLGYDFVLTSSMGHIRDLPKKKTDKGQKIAGIDLNNDYRPTYVVLEGKEGLLSELEELSGYAQQLVLATDDDREGEAMAWHLLQLLYSSNNKHQEPPIRVRFTEITRKAIVNAIEHSEPNLRDNLVQAQETRRILDRLAGFTLSPVLARKISPGLSAGRVQSVGMAMTVQRERERLTFQETEYWSVKGNFSAIDNDNKDTDRLLEAQLVSVNGQPLASGTADFDPKQTGQLALAAENKLHLAEESARELTNLIETKDDSWLWNIQKVTSTQRKRKAPLPFITSSLQQEANRRLGLSVSNCMRSAQQLYEKGYISYMRTDSIHLSEDARNAIETEITKDFGPEKYNAEITNNGGKENRKKSSKDGDNKPLPQAAHEAIRPAVQENGRFRKPDDLPDVFDTAAIEVYKLIYRRTVASHMTPQVSNQTSITIKGESDDEDDTVVLFRTSGSIVIDPGYTAVYPRQVDSKSPILPNVEEGLCLDCDGVKGLAHATQPPARYTEASFIQELEAKGVGRPSTYASIVQTLRYRSYIGSPVTTGSGRRGGGKEVSGPAISAKRAAGGEDFTGAQNARGPLVPSLSAFVVTSLLEKYCNMYVDPTFTAKMEERLDMIANSEVEVSQKERISYLNEFYEGEKGLASQIDHIDKFVDADVARRADLPALAWNSTMKFEDIGLFIGPWGPYLKKTSSAKDDSEEEKIVKAKLPPGMAADISTITLQGVNAVLKTKEEDGLVLGQHPEDGRIIRLKVGPYGGYLQWGDDNDKVKSSTHTLPRELRNFKMPDTWDEEGGESLTDMIGVNLDEAIKYCSLPRTVCMMDNNPITTAIGPYGPYLKYSNKFVPLKQKDGDVFTIQEATAREIVIDGIVNKNSEGAGVLAEIGEKDGSMITVKTGRFGDYINWNKVNAKLPAGYLDCPSQLPLEEAWVLIQEKAASSPRKTNSKKDLPPGPKRPQSSYLIFSVEKRPEAAAQFSTLGDVSKELGRLWKELSDEDKQPYVEQAAAAKAAYEVEKAKWEDQTKQLRKSSQRKKVTKSSSPNGPKRPRSAYIFFCNANRAEVSKEFDTLGKVSKELGRLWNNIDGDDKSQYEVMAAEDKLRYTREKLEGTLPLSSATSTTSKPKNRRAAPKEAKTEKRKRAPSAYMLFCASHRSQVVDEDGNKLSLPETTKILAQMWRECDEETRARFSEEADVRKKALQ